LSIRTSGSFFPTTDSCRGICSQSERLHANWYSTVNDLLGMTESEARSLAVPMRFLVTLKEALAKNKAGDSSQGGQELLTLESVDKQASCTTKHLSLGHLHAAGRNLSSARVRGACFELPFDKENFA
jgi:hypothetical protein